MSSTFVASRTQIIFAICVPLAVLLGFFLAEPLQIRSMAILLSVIGLLVSPLLLKWHHPVLVLTWNALVSFTFLPGRPEVWMLAAGMSLLIAVLNRSLHERHVVNRVPSITVPLLVLLSVVLLTALLTGGLGVRALGSKTHGGRGYFYILAAVAGYFALSSQQVPVKKRALYTALFFLPGLTTVLPNVAYSLGPSAWWMYYFVPTNYVAGQLAVDMLAGDKVIRMLGLGPASLALLSWLLAHYGLRGVFMWQRPWRMGLLLLALAACLFSGFRSALFFFVMLIVIQFFLEGLHRGPALLWAFLAACLFGVVALGAPTRLPMSVQRTLSFLPIEVSPIARTSAEDSTEWRLQMWKDLLPEMKRHLLVGKGYGFDPNDFDMTAESMFRGYSARYQMALEAGDYHSGPLSVLIPFGIWGAGAFAWFIVVSFSYLHNNYRYGDARLKTLNTLLLAYFVTETAHFVLIYGSLYHALPAFVGVVGLAICFNGVGAQVLARKQKRRRKRYSRETNGIRPSIPHDVRPGTSIVESPAS